MADKKKNIIQINESKLRNMVQGTVIKVLKEKHMYSPDEEQGWLDYINNKDVDGIPELDANMNTYDTRDMAHAYAQTGLKSVESVQGSTLNDRIKSDWGNTIQENKFTEEGLHNLIMESLVKVLKEL